MYIVLATMLTGSLSESYLSKGYLAGGHTTKDIESAQLFDVSLTHLAVNDWQEMCLTLIPRLEQRADRWEGWYPKAVTVKPKK